MQSNGGGTGGLFHAVLVGRVDDLVVKVDEKRILEVLLELLDSAQQHDLVPRTRLQHNKHRHMIFLCRKIKGEWRTTRARREGRRGFMK